jgi:hypothetical protein
MRVVSLIGVEPTLQVEDRVPKARGQELYLQGMALYLVRLERQPIRQVGLATLGIPEIDGQSRS